MSTRSSNRGRRSRKVHYLGTLNIYVAAGGGGTPRFAVELSRFHRPEEDELWDILSALTPSEYEGLHRLVADALTRLQTRGPLRQWLREL